MKLFPILFILFPCMTMAQGNNPPPWQNINTGIDNISFSMPFQPNVVDSVKFKFYHLGEDTSISFKVMILKDLPTPNGQVYETIIEAIGSKDSIQIVSADSVQYQGKICLDGKLATSTPSGSNILAFFRYFYFSDKLLCFFISGPVASQAELNSNKIQFFNSIQL